MDKPLPLCDFVRVYETPGNFLWQYSIQHALSAVVVGSRVFWLRTCRRHHMKERMLYRNITWELVFWEGFKTCTQIETKAVHPFSALIKHSFQNLQENTGETITQDCSMKILHSCKNINHLSFKYTSCFECYFYLTALTLTRTKICAPRELSLSLTPWRWGPTGSWWSMRGPTAYSQICPWLCMTTLPNASPLPLATLTSLTLNMEPSLFLEAYFTVPCGIFWQYFLNYNLEMIFSLTLINLLNKYANISSALYKKIHTRNKQPLK